MLKQSFDTHIPEKMITITLHPKNPWFSDEPKPAKKSHEVFGEKMGKE